ncbi:hypothetical protein DD681_00005 [Buchnera aphidicola (Melanaphis sacchari)]|uniref:Ancillary SecYEG translocon subunit n=1 Tax=Buchnera aphidicola (Melanaphis sacchari) TaxID=2173854 RepID=A0A2U8DFG3_9GAMM|nr:tetratricopeptide repeat protein [Buchnera aphidicola]AWH90225.1 hypothetical protein DD681_00005 [Buchnera aphidicola (Melanaphis sacchari)]
MHLIQSNQIKKNISIKKIIFLIILFLIIFCFFWFKNHINKNSLNIEKKIDMKYLKYEEIQQKINQKNIKNFNEAEQFILDNKNIYGTLASFSLAKKYILNNNLDKALDQLNNSLKYTKEENLKNILNLRIAKIQIQKKQNKDAIKTLEKINNKNWISIVENLKGDIFIEKKDIQKAIKSWEKSKKFEKSDAFKELVKMKINHAKQINANAS